MNDLLDQIEASLYSKQYYLSLMVTLTVPDIAGALNSLDGIATGQRYSAWFEEWVHPEFNKTVQLLLPEGMKNIEIEVANPLTGDDCYRFRCSLLHQGTTQHPKVRIREYCLLSQEPLRARCITASQMMRSVSICPAFCTEVLRGARKWLAAVAGTEPFESNLPRFVRRPPSGLPPYIGGAPVVG